MTRKISIAIGGALAALICAWGLASTASARPTERDLSGRWELSGWNMGSDREADPDYTGSVKVEARGEGTYLVEWSVDGKVVNEGVGIYDERTDTFAAAYAIGESPGVAIWEISEDGRVMDCVGTFEKRVGNVAREEWRRPE